MSIEYKLKDNFKYPRGGEFPFAEMLAIKAPNNKVLREVNLIEKQVMKSLQSFSDQQESSQSESKDSENITGDQVVMGLLASEADTYKCYEALRSILVTPGMCKIDGEINLTNNMYQDISYKDIKCILGEYIVSFFDIFQAS